LIALLSCRISTNLWRESARRRLRPPAIVVAGSSTALTASAMDNQLIDRVVVYILAALSFALVIALIGKLFFS
jgi:hypothetical protein